MKRGVVLALLMGAALAACSEAEMSEEAAADAVAVAPAADAAVEPIAEASHAAPADAEPITVVESQVAPTVAEPRAAARRAVSGPAMNIPQLAYSYKYRIEAPAKSIDLLVGKHEAACQAAGPAVCQITGADVRRVSERNVTGTLSLRARPDWMAAFRAGLAADAEGVGGKIAASNTGADDLSASIVDAQAQIRAKEIAGDRLEDLMRRTGKIEDLANVERELAEMRGEIDAAKSNLALMKNRVRMSSMTIDYGPKGSLAEDGAWRPVGDAVRASQGLAASVVAFLIMLTAGLAPIAVAGGAIFLAVRRLRKKSAVQTAAPAA